MYINWSVEGKKVQGFTSKSSQLFILVIRNTNFYCLVHWWCTFFILLVDFKKKSFGSYRLQLMCGKTTKHTKIHNGNKSVLSEREKMCFTQRMSHIHYSFLSQVSNARWIKLIFGERIFFIYLNAPKCVPNDTTIKM